MDKLQLLLDAEPFLVLDGAMGTILMAMGLEQGAPPEEWNVSQPDRIQTVHRQYVQAGARVILTNSFGGTRQRLKLHRLEGRVEELNAAAARNARVVADAAPETVLVAGSMGPTGELLAPMGSMTFAAARDSFAEQARGLAAGGADLIWIETMSDLDEVRAAVEGARSATDLPVTATLSFDTNGRTMMGVTAVQALAALAPLGLAAVGANCGHNLPDTMAAIEAMHREDPHRVLIAKANAGIPRWGEDGELVYDGTPAVMAGYAYHVHRLGARLIGACCGSTPAHIAAMRAALTGETSPEALRRPVRAKSSTPALSPGGNGRKRNRARRHRG